MAITYVDSIDLTQNEVQNAALHELSADPGSPVEGQVWENTTSHRAKIYNGTAVKILAYQSDSLSVFGTPSGDLDIGSHKLINVADPTSGTDAANKQYVDAVAAGLDVKKSVVVASSTNITVASGLTNGTTIDGVTVATGDRVLLYGQTAPAENGIYVVASAGAASRATDCSTSANYNAGDFCFVEEGTAHAASGFIVNTQGVIVVGTTPVTWVQMSGSASYTAGSGVKLVGSQFQLDPDAVTIYVDGSSKAAVKSSATQFQTLISNGSSTTPTWGAVSLNQAAAVSGALPIANGGTGQITAAAALAALGGTTKFAVSVGNASATNFTINHNLNTRDVVWSIYDNTGSNDYVDAEVDNIDANNIKVFFSVAPSLNRYRVTVIG